MEKSSAEVVLVSLRHHLKVEQQEQCIHVVKMMVDFAFLQQRKMTLAYVG